MTTALTPRSLFRLTNVKSVSIVGVPWGTECSNMWVLVLIQTYKIICNKNQPDTQAHPAIDQTAYMDA